MEEKWLVLVVSYGQPSAKWLNYSEQSSDAIWLFTPNVSEENSKDNFISQTLLLDREGIINPELEAPRVQLTPKSNGTEVTPASFEEYDDSHVDNDVDEVLSGFKTPWYRM